MMGKGIRHKNERILNPTLEIIYLLTGEDYAVLKKTCDEGVTSGGRSRVSGGGSRTHSPITGPLPHSLIHEQKILDLTNKIIHLLTGEVPIRCQDVTVYFSMEEWEYIEGHKDLYKDVMAEDHLPLTSPGKRDLCRDVMMEDHQTPSPGKRDLYKHVMMEDHRNRTSPDGSSRKWPAGRCASPVNPKDRPEKNHNVRQSHQAEELVIIKVEEVEGLEEEGETFIWHDWQNTEENILTDTSLDGSMIKNTLEKCLMLSSDCNIDNDKPAHNSPGHYPISHNITDSHNGRIAHGSGDKYQCSECGKCFTQNGSLNVHKRIHTGEKPFSCSECGKLFMRKSDLVRHYRVHTGEKPFVCSVCGKCFSQKSKLVSHQRTHTGEILFPCPECGRCFTNRAILATHLKFHSGENPFQCSDCGTCFQYKSYLVKHQIIHTKTKPFSCSECGKYLTNKGALIYHLRTHTGEKPFSCSECGRCFTSKGHLVTHKRTHTGEKPFSCAKCGKRFARKADMAIHQIMHSIEEPFSCSN